MADARKQEALIGPADGSHARRRGRKGQRERGDRRPLAAATRLSRRLPCGPPAVGAGGRIQAATGQAVEGLDRRDQDAIQDTVQKGKPADRWLVGTSFSPPPTPAEQFQDA
jgi:hypothetical protein